MQLFHRDTNGRAKEKQMSQKCQHSEDFKKEFILDYRNGIEQRK
jgi:hypothetical protein